MRPTSRSACRTNSFRRRRPCAGSAADSSQAAWARGSCWPRSSTWGCGGGRGRRQQVEAGLPLLHDGDEPPDVDPHRDLRRDHQHLQRDDPAAAAVKGNIVLVEGMPSGNLNDGHGASDSLTGQGFGYYGQGVIKISVDQFVANKLVASGINRPIGSLLLGANTSDNGGISQFYGGATGGNLPTIGSPLSAFTTVFGGGAARRHVRGAAARPPAEHPRRRHRRVQHARAGRSAATRRRSWTPTSTPSGSSRTSSPRACPPATAA